MRFFQVIFALTLVFIQKTLLGSILVSSNFGWLFVDKLNLADDWGLRNDGTVVGCSGSGGGCSGSGGGGGGCTCTRGGGWTSVTELADDVILAGWHSFSDRVSDSVTLCWLDLVTIPAVEVTPDELPNNLSSCEKQARYSIIIWRCK